MKVYDSFFETPGTVTERFCQVCGTECMVERNMVGPTGWATAMAKVETVHDYFYGPHKNQPWHDQAMALVQVIENTPSKRIASIIQSDLIDLLTEHGCNIPK